MSVEQGLVDSLAAAVAQASTAVVAVHGREHTPSSGVIWQPGIIVTTNHTTKKEEELRVTLSDGRTVAATLAGRDPGTDLAVLRVAEEGLPAAQFGDSAALRVGQIALAVGRGPTAAFGIIHSLGGPWRTWRGGQVDRSIHLDLAIYVGFSGSALVDASGRIIGLNTSGLSRNQALALPLTTVQRVADQLLAKGHLSRGYLGIGMQPVNLPSGIRTEAETAVIVLSVEPDSPAARAGLLLGDVVLRVGTHVIAEPDDLQAALEPETVGQAVPVSILRAGQSQEIAVTVGERPRRRK